MINENASVNLKVSTTALLTKADETERYINELEHSILEIRNHVKKIEGYWIGEASVIYREMYQRQIEEAETIIIRLKSYVGNLRTVAAIYFEGEKEVSAAVNELQGNVID